jgi:integrase
LTYNNIVSWNDWISGILNAQPSIAKHHEVVNTYAKMATKAGLMPHGSNPYLKFEFTKGKNKPRTVLDDDEIKKLLKAPKGITRDLAVVQLYTGLAHKDMINLTETGNVAWNGKDAYLQGLRKKSSEQYTTYLHPDVVEIIKRYRGGEKLLPCPDLYQYNRDLKVLAAGCGITKTLTSYVLRHTYAVWMLRKDVPITTIQETMGHSSIETTMIYAKISQKKALQDMKKAFQAPKKRIPNRSK